MSGIFGGGVLVALQKKNLYNKIERVYAESAGAINAAYFLTKQSKLGSTIYYEDLTNNFIFPFNIVTGTIQRFWNRYIHKIPEKKIINAINIDYLFDIVKNKKILNVKKLKEQNIDFYVKVLNIDTGKVRYLDIKKNNIINVLKAAICIAPYYHNFQEINGKKCIDAGVKQPIGLKYLLNKHPHNKIIAIINMQPIRKDIYYVRNFVEGMVAEMTHPHANLLKFLIKKEESVRNDFKLYLNNKRVLLIYPPENTPAISSTTNRSKLLEEYKIGKKEIKKIENFLNL